MLFNLFTIRITKLARATHILQTAKNALMAWLVEKNPPLCEVYAYDVNNKPCVDGTGHTDRADGLDNADRVKDSKVVVRVCFAATEASENGAVAANVRNGADFANHVENENDGNDVANTVRQVRANDLDSRNSMDDA